jgi:predicted transposase/invertase (TIGR01784 family)
MPNFNMQESDLETRLDKWLYFIKHLEDFQSIPTVFKDQVFIQAFEKAELAKFGQAELDNYEYSLKVFRDNKAVFEYAIDTAFDEGKIEGKIEVAKTAKQMGLSTTDIIKLTGLSESEINML